MADTNQPKTVKALYNFKPQNTDEVSFRVLILSHPLWYLLCCTNIVQNASNFARTQNLTKEVEEWSLKMLPKLCSNLLLVSVLIQSLLYQYNLLSPNKSWSTSLSDSCLFTFVACVLQGRPYYHHSGRWGRLVGRYARWQDRVVS